MNVLPRDEAAVLYASPLSGYAYKAALLLRQLLAPFGNGTEQAAK